MRTLLLLQAAVMVAALVGCGDPAAGPEEVVVVNVTGMS